jgi:hypothetical protein
MSDQSNVYRDDEFGRLITRQEAQKRHSSTRTEEQVSVINPRGCSAGLRQDIPTVEHLDA